MTEENTHPCCYHCGEHIPDGVNLHTVIAGESRAMCCPGCKAVASLIAGSGLDNFYHQRTAYNERPVNNVDAPSDQFLIYDEAELAQQFSSEESDGSIKTRLLLDGISCAACTWLIEHSFERVTGVISAQVNLQQSRLDLQFDPAEVKLSALFEHVDALGYRPRPFQASMQREQLNRDYKRDLRRLSVAGFGMMQVGMFAVALHAGDIQGITSQYQGLLRGFSLLISTFVVFYSASTFFSTAWRHLKQGALVMDLPVALAIGLAWLASAWATFTGGGQVYFDSVVMFTFFLLLGRFMEQRVRQRHAMTWFNAQSTLPDAVSLQHREQDDTLSWSTVPRSQLVQGDIILIPAGQTIAIDGAIVHGESAVREDTFNGEHLPRSVGPGAAVYAGTVNVEAAIQVAVSGSYLESRLAALQQSVEFAQGEKPRLAKMADRISSWFVAAVLLITSTTALIWWQIDPDQALWIALSVLVISCPCALALATPAALTSAANSLRAKGVIVRGENALESLSRTTHMVFDKTGTLTRGQLSISKLEATGELRDTDVLAIASALQQWSKHPVAKAFTDIEPLPGLTDVEYTVGSGLEGRYQDTVYRMGSERFCREFCPTLTVPPDESFYWVALCTQHNILAWIGLSDTLREEAKTVIDSLSAAGLKPALLTGDSSPQGQLIATELGILEVHTGLLPQQKMHYVQQLQSELAVVTMVGDGLNDAPVLSVANSSFAVAGATDLARTQADFVIAEDSLTSVTETWQKAKDCRRIIIQNFCWALGYNTSAIPLAALGYIPPWAAAIGMSLSSLLVVLNSLRLQR